MSDPENSGEEWKEEREKKAVFSDRQVEIIKQIGKLLGEHFDAGIVAFTTTSDCGNYEITKHCYTGLAAAAIGLYYRGADKASEGDLYRL